MKAYQEMDPGEMRQRIAEFPQQCRDAWALVQQPPFPENLTAVRQVVVLGMGGSAIGGALLAGLVADECPIPVFSVGGYDLPAYVGPDTLVIVSSYSGHTEETLATFEQALDRNCPLVGVTTGGKLAARLSERGFPLLRFAYQAPPRASLGYSFTMLLGLLCRLGLVQDQATELAEAIAVMEDWQQTLRPDIPKEHNPAKQQAERLWNRLPVIYGAGFLSTAARRWKGQFNENAKNWACWEELPELNHNAVVGFQLPAEVRDRVLVLMLRSSLDHPRVKARWEVTREMWEKAGGAWEEIWGRGQSRLSQMLSVIHFGDYVSYYLAMLNVVDPTPVTAIDFLKQRLSEIV